MKNRFNILRGIAAVIISDDAGTCVFEIVDSGTESKCHPRRKVVQNISYYNIWFVGQYSFQYLSRTSQLIFHFSVLSSYFYHLCIR